MRTSISSLIVKKQGQEKTIPNFKNEGYKRITESELISHFESFWRELKKEASEPGLVLPVKLNFDYLLTFEELLESALNSNKSRTQIPEELTRDLDDIEILEKNKISKKSLNTVHVNTEKLLNEFKKLSFLNSLGSLKSGYFYHFLIPCSINKIEEDLRFYTKLIEKINVIGELVRKEGDVGELIRAGDYEGVYKEMCRVEEIRIELIGVQSVEQMVQEFEHLIR